MVMIFVDAALDVDLDVALDAAPDIALADVALADAGRALVKILVLHVSELSQWAHPEFWELVERF